MMRGSSNKTAISALLFTTLMTNFCNRVDIFCHINKISPLSWTYQYFCGKLLAL
jgi:hypothetical protein